LILVSLIQTAVSVPIEVLAKNFMLMSDQADKYSQAVSKLAKNKKEAEVFAS